MQAPAIPVWLKFAYGLGFVVIAISYWYAYGPANYLWLSDIALALTTLAVITGNRLLASMAAIGVLPLELGWMLDFVLGGSLIGIAAYMFDDKLSFYLRLLSGFHLALPPTLVWMMWRFGYDRRALPRQIAISVAALIASYILTGPEENINWVYGPGTEAQHALPPLLYFGMVLLAIGVLMPAAMHVLLKWLFGDRSG